MTRWRRVAGSLLVASVALAMSCLDFDLVERQFCDASGTYCSPPEIDSIAFITPAQEAVPLNGCSGAVTVQLRDQYGNAATAGSSGHALTLSSSDANPSLSFEFYPDAACGLAAIASIRVEAGASSATFYFKSTAVAAGTVTITVADGARTASQVQGLVLRTQLAFVTAPKTQAAGDCSAGPITVETRDSSGAALNVLVPTTITFGTPDGNLGLFADSLCQNALTAVTIAAGNARANAYLRGTISGTARVTASAPGMTGAEQTHTIQPGPTAQLIFTSPAQTALPLNQCSEPATVQLRDAFGNPTPVGTARTLTLSSDASPGASFRFYPDAACALAAITATPVAAGAATSTFYFKSTATSPGQVTITVADGVRTATQTQTLVQRTPTQLQFITAPFTVPLGSCSPAVTLQTQDAAGLPAPVISATNIPLSSAGTAALTFHSNATCTSGPISQVSIAASTNVASFYFKGSTQGSATITANGGSFGSPAQTETITPPVATQLAFATGAQSATAGACSGAVEIESRDGSGFPTPVSTATQVDLAVAPGGVLSLFAGVGCGGAPITTATLAAGTSKVTISFRGTVAGSSTITASTPGGVLTSTQQVETVTPAAAAKIVITAGKGQTLAAGACGTINIQLQDAFDNPVIAGSNQVVNLSSSPIAGMSLYATSNCSGSVGTTAQISSGGSQGAFSFKGTAAGSYTITETPQNTALTGDSALETITGGTATALAFTSAPQSALVAGTCSQPVVLTSRDSLGNTAPVSGNTTITPGSTGLTGVTFFSDAPCTTAVSTVLIPNQGTSVSYYFRTNTPGSGTLTASAAGLTAPTPQPVTVVPGAPTQLVFTLGPVTVPAGTCSGAAPGFPLAIETRDASGNPAPVAANTDVLISGANGTGTITFHTGPGCSGGVTTLRINAGSASTGNFYFRTNKAGTWALTGSFTGLTSATQNETVTPGPPAALGYTSPAQTVPAGACSARVTFEVRDPYGNLSPPTSTTTVNLTPGADAFYRNSGCTLIVVGNQLTMSSGQVEGQYWFLAPGAVGPYTIDITSPGLTSASQVETIE